MLIACRSADLHFSCSPTPSCSLRDTRFAPPKTLDAAPLACDPTTRTSCTARAISAGGKHSCAIAAAGELFCWGDDSEHQLGPHLGAAVSDASLLDAAAEWTDVSLVLEHAVQVTVGAAHSCALFEDGSVRCWGRNAEGQVDGTDQPEPVAVPRRVDVPGATQLAAGAAHSCSVAPQGVVCWGSARYGQVGRELRDGALAPALVPDTAGAVEVAAGVRHTCARFDDGHVLCWGELIDPESLEPIATPIATPVAGLNDAKAITAGAGHSCGLRKSGAVVCWGANESGQLGDGGTKPSARPVRVTNLPFALRVAAGGGETDGLLVGHSCAIDNYTNVACWGGNREGELGVGQQVGDRSAVVVAVLGRPKQNAHDLTNMVELALGAFHSCSLDHDGSVVCWGDDSSNQLGRDRSDPWSFGRSGFVARFGR